MTYSYPSQGPVRSRLSYWTRHPYKPQLVWGMWFGWFSAGVYSLVALVIAGLRRSTYFPQLGVGLGRVIAAYWIAGTLAGIVLAFAYPLRSNRWGSALLGFLVGMIVYSVIGVAMLGMRPFVLGAALIPAVLIGAGLGVVFHDDTHSEPRG